MALSVQALSAVAAQVQSEPEPEPVVVLELELVGVVTLEPTHDRK